MYVGFYESIGHDPAALLRDLFAFLGVNPDVDLSAFPLTQRILPGPPGDLSPHLGRFLHRLLHRRAVELATFLQERFGLKSPTEWRTVLEPAVDMPSSGPLSDPLLRKGEFTDADLSRVLGQEATFPLAHRVFIEDHYGFRMVFHRGRLFAVAQDASHVNLHEAGEAELRRWREEGCCFTASTLTELKERVVGRVLDGTASRLRSLEADLRDAREQTALLTARLDETARAVAKLGGDALRLSAKEHAFLRPCAAPSKPFSGPGGYSPRSPQAPGKPALTARPVLWDRRALLTSAPYRAQAFGDGSPGPREIAFPAKVKE